MTIVAGLGLRTATAQAPSASQPKTPTPEALLAELTLPQKAGQLFMSWSLSRSAGEGEANNHERMLQWVREAELGGVILSLGTVADAADLVPRLQAASKVPLLLAGDFEGGVWFRLKGGTELGNNMLFGATRSEWLVEQAGRVTGEEARALGFHWVFAPVLDVNSNPANPIINVRSFGEDPQLVARLGAAFTRGVQSTGLIACGKHFPGHGDVDSDSHLELPTVPGDGARLRSVELAPFAAAAKAGLASVMTGHLAVPGLGEDPTVPATLSSRILRGVLREELGFDGLIVTDALEMGGVKNAFPPGEVAVRALLAGADVLLMPPDPLAARAAVVAAVESGRVSPARLDEAVLRILRAKARVGLLAGGSTAGRGRVSPRWSSELRTVQSRGLARQIAQRGVTVVRDRGELLPIRQTYDRAVAVMIEDRPGTAAAPTARPLAGAPLRLSSKSSAAEVAQAVAAVADAELVYLDFFIKVREYSGGIAVPPAVQPLLEALQPEQMVVAVSFGNPYLIADLPVVDTYICAYVDTLATHAAVDAAITGSQAVSGRLPVTIPGVAKRGAGLTRYRWTPRRPAEVGYDVVPGLAGQLRQRLQTAIEARAFPGAVCLVARHGEVVAEVTVGHQSYEKGAALVRRDTLYDLASLTKVCATTPAVLRLVAEGRLTLDDPVQKWVPAFEGTGKAKVTVRHLLAHCSGLPSYVRFFRTMSGKDTIVEAAAREGLMVEPGTKMIYSDLGFILLMAVVEAASEQPFEEYSVGTLLWRDHHRARFVATDGWSAGAAPTELDPARGGIVEGYVHDENAYAMGGVSGHAGLFATADDVLDVGLDLLAGGRGNLPRNVVELVTRPAGLVAGDTSRAVGYQLPKRGSWAGTTVSPGTFGHTGFTGTSLLCDPELDLCVVLLTNRVHPTRVNNRITQVRRDVHDLVRAAMR